jgi:hypothetical protein
MRHTIPHQELGLSACDSIVVSSIKKPVETASMRLECGNRYCGQYNSELSHKSCQASNPLGFSRDRPIKAESWNFILAEIAT